MASPKTARRLGNIFWFFLSPIRQLAVHLRFTMSVNWDKSHVPKKRKRGDVLPTKQSTRYAVSDEEGDYRPKILLLESKILESRTNYNDITTLLGYVQSSNTPDERGVFAAVALCRIFCRLMAAGNFNRAKDLSDNQLTVVQWLVERLVDFRVALLTYLRNENVSVKSSALTLLMRLLKDEAKHVNFSDQNVWSSSNLNNLIDTLVEDESSAAVREQFIEQFAKRFDDVRYHVFARLGYV